MCGARTEIEPPEIRAFVRKRRQLWAQGQNSRGLVLWAFRTRLWVAGARPQKAASGAGGLAAYGFAADRGFDRIAVGGLP